MATLRAIGLLERGHKILPTSGDEPDIKVAVKCRTCWIEATAADAGIGANQVPKLRMGTINPDNIKLRLTTKIRDKAFGPQYERWGAAQVIKETDFYIIALNGADIPNADIAGGPVNVMEQCLFGLGPLAWQIAVPTGEVLNAGHTFQESIKKNRAGRTVEIDNNFFLRPEMNHVSAIIYSPYNFVNSYDRYGVDIKVIHNPLAQNKLPLGTFRFGKELWIDKKGMLRTRDHTKTNWRWQWRQLKLKLAVKWFIIKNHRQFQRIKNERNQKTPLPD